VRSLAREIVELMRNDGLCHDAGSRGIAYAAAQLHPGVHRRRLEGVYENAALNAGPRTYA
jgi:hypothetical protein